jgi:TonB family protein
MGRFWAAWAAAIGLGLAGTPALAAVSSNALVPVTAEAPAAPTTTRADWVAKPSGDDVSEAYPQLAQTFGVAGRVVLRCKVATTGRTEDCQVLSETPKGFGFGDAALKIAPLFRMAPATAGGSATASDVRIPIRFALPPGDPRERAAVALIGAVILVILALAANDWIRGRSAVRMPVGAAVAYSLRFAARVWRRAPGPQVIYLLFLVAVSLWTSNEGAASRNQPVVTLVSLVLGLLLSGSALRLGLSDLRPADPYLRPGPLGLKFAGVELRVFAASLVEGLVIMTGVAALAVVGIILMAVVRATIQDETQQALAAALFMAVAVIAALWGALRLWTFVPAAIYRRRLPLGEAWRATRAAIFSPLAAGLLICLVAVLAGLVPLILAVILDLVLKIDISRYAAIAVGVLITAILQPALTGLTIFAFRTLHQPEREEP